MARGDGVRVIVGSGVRGIGVFVRVGVRVGVAVRAGAIVAAGIGVLVAGVPSGNDAPPSASFSLS